ncbi:MAG: AAA family ATPase [Candidatus Sericytochromatia bacterium]|nr:AAA family ATPase [Candidatus Tanganyikabacteria bacterium]
MNENRTPEPIPQDVPEGGRDNALTSLAGTMRRRGATERVILAALGAKNSEFSSPLPQRDLERIARSVARYEPGDVAVNGRESPGLGGPGGSDFGQWRMITTPLSAVEAVEIDWTWAGRIPRGELTVLAGDPGVGKSYLIGKVAACVTVGMALPGQEPRRSGVVLLVDLENSPAPVLRPRLEGMGADLDRIVIYETIRDDSSGQSRGVQLPGDIGLLESEITRLGAELVVIDSLVAVQDRALDGHKQAEMRAILGPLHEVAQRTGAAIVVLVHLNKDEGRSAQYRVGGSIDLLAAARVVLIVGKDPNDGHRRGVAVLKTNLGEEPPPVAFNLRGGTFEWSQEPADDLTKDVLTAKPATARGPNLSADLWLRTLLHGGPMRATAIQQAASRESPSIGWRRLEAARERLGVVIYYVPEPGKQGRGISWWRLPSHDPHGPERDSDPRHTGGGGIVFRPSGGAGDGASPRPEYSTRRNPSDGAASRVVPQSSTEENTNTPPWSQESDRTPFQTIEFPDRDRPRRRPPEPFK